MDGLVKLHVPFSLSELSQKRKNRGPIPLTPLLSLKDSSVLPSPVVSPRDHPMVGWMVSCWSKHVKERFVKVDAGMKG